MNMSGNTSAPLITLKGNTAGKAPTISYNVPEPTSYSGRYFIELNFGAEIFNLDLVKKISNRNFEQQLLASIAIPDVEDVKKAMMNGFSDEAMFPHIGQYAGLIRLQKNSDGGYEMKSNLPLSPELARLNPEEVYSAITAGKSLMVYLSSFGTLSYEYIVARHYVDAAPVDNDTSIDVTTDVSTTQNNIDSSSSKSAKIIEPSDGDGLSTITGPFGKGIWFIFPVNGATIPGPAAGISIDIRGQASMITESISGEGDFTRLPEVEVSINEDEFKSASSTSADKPLEWSFQHLVTNPGNLTITAKATWLPKFGNAIVKAYRISTNVSLAKIEDHIAPTINITSPANWADIGGPKQGVPVNIAGTAKDEDGGSGVQQVYVQVGSEKPFAMAKPKSTNDWSSWSFSGFITTQGVHTITAKAVDKAGNENISQIKVKVSSIPQTPTKPLYRPSLFLIETYRLSSFLGQYGAGRTIKTFSLLPGEKTKITVKTYLKTEQEAKQSSSILDSVTDESTKDFENTLSNEQSNKQEHQKASSYEISATAKASWGCASAEVSGGVKGSTNASQEEFAKNMSST